EARRLQWGIGIACDPRADRRRVAHLVTDGRREEAALGVLEDVGDVAAHVDGTARRTQHSREEQAERALPGAIGADDRRYLGFVQLERRTAHRIAVVSAVAMGDAAGGDRDPSRRAPLAPDRSPAWPPIDEQRRGLIEVTRHPFRAEDPRELGELRLPDPEPIELAGASHEDRLGIAREGEVAFVAEHRDAVDETEERVEAVLDHEERALAP